MGEDVTGISGTNVEFLAILCFISPCHQELSGSYCTKCKMYLGQTNNLQ